MPNQEKSPDVAGATRELQSKLDELMTPLQFQELLEMAEEVCLTHRPHYPSEQEVSGETALIAQLGTRGIKAALELAEDIVTMADDERIAQADFEDERLRPITLDTPLRLTERFSNGVDFTILAKAEAFGAQIMTESFRILGQDAYQKVEEFKQATKKEQQLAVINWLDTRLRTIVGTSTPFETVSEDQDTFLYHPARLSPKLIGTYPHNNLTPTCLGVSIIASEFFKRAGADTLHANVAHRGIEEDHLQALLFIRRLQEEITAKFGLSFPEKLDDSLTRVAKQHTKAFTEMQALHAAVYLRLIDGTWAQFDSNFMSSIPIDGLQANQTLTDSYEVVTAASTYAPGIEVSAHLDDLLSPGEVAQVMFKRQDPAVITTLIDRTYQEFQDDNAESFPQRIYDTCIEPFFNEDSNDTLLNTMHQIFTSVEISYGVNLSEKHIQHAFYTLFEKYVLWGKSPQEVIDQMHKDDHYLFNRVMDVAVLPFMVLASATSVATKNSGFLRPHALIELGLPEQRIGLAVLSDFATYTDSPLSASFWMSHWPSSAAVFENLQGASRSSFEDSLIYNNVAYGMDHPLTSRHNYAIIQSFVNSRQP